MARTRRKQRSTYTCDHISQLSVSTRRTRGKSVSTGNRTISKVSKTKRYNKRRKCSGLDINRKESSCPPIHDPSSSIESDSKPKESETGHENLLKEPTLFKHLHPGVGNGMAILPDGRVMVIVNNEQKLFIFSADFEVLSKCDIEYGPMGLVTVSANKIATSNDRKITIYKISDANRIAETVDMRLRREGATALSYNNGKFAIMYADRNGHTVDIYKFDERENKIDIVSVLKLQNRLRRKDFQNEFLLLDPVDDQFYVCDIYSDALLCVSFSGKLLWKYNHGSELCIFYDDDSAMYRFFNISYFRQRLTEISSSGKLIREIIDFGDLLTRENHICFHEKEKKILVFPGRNCSVCGITPF